MAKIKICGAKATTNFPASKYVAAMKRLGADELSVEDFCKEIREKAFKGYPKTTIKRARLDKKAVTHMKEVLQRTPNPSKKERHKIAEIFGITKEQVRAWFRSARLRMKSKESN